jgi:CheY-like chemotaxis protein
MKVLLKKMNLKFDIVNDGLEAIEAFKNSKYNLILMDENMPNMSGIEATKYILQYEKDNNLEHTPIVALTANALKGDRVRFLEAGMDEYLTKPLDKNKLSNIFNKIL